MYRSYRTEYSVKDFISKYHTKFPLLAVVTQGYHGNSDLDTFATGQVIRIHSVKAVPRVIGIIANDDCTRTTKALSLPLSANRDIWIKTSKGRRKSLAKITRKGLLPYEGFISNDDPLGKYNDASCFHQKSIQLLLERQVELRFLLGNPVSGVELLNRILVLPEYLQDLRLSVVIGIEGLNTEQWNKLQTYMVEVVQTYINFDNFNFSEGIIALPDTDDETHTLHTYEYIYCNPLNSQGTTKKEEYDSLQPKPLNNSQEHIYHTIPDNNCEYLSFQSLEWKQMLNMGDEKDATGSSLQNAENLPDSDSSTTKNVPPPLPRKPIRHKVEICPDAGFDKKCHASNTTHLESEETAQAADQSNQITEMSIKDIGKILERLNLHEYVDSFAGALVDGMILKEFNKTTLEEFGFKSIQSIRLLKFIQCGHIPK
ncbi:uncharacterized protein LOC134700499 isoform X1 [Mytilus trossulus]|uniref:uncharacterized protein LOC134700499 isoform X1 n=1 Tax=Mytilus trossulus TaxID=6551 RepID=UPI003003CD72